MIYTTQQQRQVVAAQYWADIAVKSDHPAAPLAHVPGVFAVLWTPDTAPTTAITLATAGYGFAALPKNLIHFTTAHGTRRIATSGTIKSTTFGLFGPGVYMARGGWHTVRNGFGLSPLLFHIFYIHHLDTILIIRMKSLISAHP